MSVDSNLKEWRENELASERHNNIWRTQNYVLPIVRSLFDGTKDLNSIKILSVGCGNGEDVDVLSDEGYYAMGVDSGYRSADWVRRKYKERFRVADAKKLPFLDEHFDLILCFGVIEHIGAIGDSRDLFPNYKDQRKQFATELMRLTKKGGHIMMTTPNKKFPLDMWHGPFLWGARPHLPTDNFLLSASDIKKLFANGKDQYSESRILELENFFQYKKSGRQIWVRWLLPFIKPVIKAISRIEFLKSSFINPFLIMLIRKK